MNSVAQLRLIFENHYAKDQLELEDLQKFQVMLTNAVSLAAQQFADSNPLPPPSSDTKGT